MSIFFESFHETSTESFFEELSSLNQRELVTNIGTEVYLDLVAPTLTPIVLPERPREDFCRPKYHNILSQRCKFTGSSDMQKPLILPKDLYEFTCGGLFPFVPVRIPDWPKKALSGLIIPKT